MQFDETEAIAFIRKYMPAAISAKYTDDEILNIIDMIWDYYEDNGFLEIPTDDDANDEEPQFHNILAYVKKMLAKDKLAVVDIDDAHYIVEGELAYEESIDIEE
jgi:hypothetical protein